MTIKGHILRTASEIAMGRYMRAPDHQAAGAAAGDDFSSAFDDLIRDDDKPAAGAADDKGGGDGAGDDTGASAAGGDGASGDGDAGPAAGGEGDDTGAAGGEAAPGDPPADDAAAAAEKAKEGDGAAAEPPAADAGKPGKAAKSKAPAAADPAAADKDDSDDVLKRLADLVKDKPAAAADDKEPAAADEKPLFTAEEEAKLDHFRKEWPEVAEAFDLQAKGLAHAVLKHAFSEIGKEFTPLRDMVETLAARTHYGDLKEKVGEYTEEERAEIIEWVNEQPTYLQTAMMSVIEQGTAEEVADLVSRYREATGKQPAGAQDADTGAPGGDSELSSEAKKAAAALAPVSSKRSAVQAPEDKSDFDGAFAKFADML